jgi:hypothetical protein
MIILSSTVASYRVGRRGWPYQGQGRKKGWNCLVKVPEPIFTVEQRFMGHRKRWLALLSGAPVARAAIWR